MKNFKTALAFAAAALVSTGAMAQSSYISGAIGASDADIDCAGAATCDKRGTAAKLVTGLEMGNGWAGELGYINFGKAKVADAGASATFKAQALQLGGAYQAQFSPDWGLNVRLGVAYVKTKVSATLSGVGSGSDSENNTAPYVGLGLNYALSKLSKLELGVDFTKAEYGGEKADVRAVTVGLRQSF